MHPNHFNKGYTHLIWTPGDESTFLNNRSINEIWLNVSKTSKDLCDVGIYLLYIYYPSMWPAELFRNKTWGIATSGVNMEDEEKRSYQKSYGLPTTIFAGKVLVYIFKPHLFQGTYWYIIQITFFSGKYWYILQTTCFWGGYDSFCWGVVY